MDGAVCAIFSPSPSPALEMGEEPRRKRRPGEKMPWQGSYNFLT